MKTISTGRELMELYQNINMGREAGDFLKARFREAVAVCHPGSSIQDVSLDQYYRFVLLEFGDDPADLAEMGLGTSESNLRNWIPEVVSWHELDGQQYWEIVILFNNQLVVTILAPVCLFVKSLPVGSGEWQFMQYVEDKDQLQGIFGQKRTA
ncbi:MAG: hypothetical protein HQM09_08485 [Candidatus Riflebacteria bacterium]|nr:hypothetical protein [Candidatus Riflebacteria bacterium]